MEWDNISDVETLKSMLSAQQQQLQQLQDHETESKGGSKRKSSSSMRRAERLMHGSGSDSEQEDVHLDKDDEVWDPADDSDYDDEPKRRGGSGKKKQSKKRSSTDSADVQGREQEKTAKAAASALKSIKSSINQQMVYKQGLKYGTSRVSLELPCLSEPVVAAMLGPQLLAKASNGKKQLQLKATVDDLGLMYGGWAPFYKTLRYGATLELVAGLTLTFNKASSVLKVTGSYSMKK